MKKDLPNVTLIGVEDRAEYLPRLKLAADICKKDFSFGSVKLLSPVSDSDPRVISVPKMGSTIAYSEFCIKEMWKYIDTEYALIIQYDGFILNPSAWTDKFLQYDYIGAPWYHQGNHGMVGNGGFSLRSKRLLDFIGKNYTEIGGTLHPEDEWICKKAKPYIEKAGMKFAPLEVASRFSKEGNQRSVFWDGQLGWHGLTYTDISKWLGQHPEYQENFVQKFDYFTQLMRKYPVYDGTVHVLRAKPRQVRNYKKLASGEKDYDCRMDRDLTELDEIKPGHTIVYKLSRITVEKVGVPPFERKVKSVERFSSKKELLTKHPDIKISMSFNIPRWKQRLAKLFGNLMYPDNQAYTLIYFEKK